MFDRARWQTLFDELEVRWARHVAFLDSDPSRPLWGRGDPWNARDEFAHHWRWIDRDHSRTCEYLAGRPPPEDHAIDALNSTWTAADRVLSLEDARQRAQEAWQGYLDFLRGLTDDARDAGFVFEEAQGLLLHLDEHIEAMVEGGLRDESVLWEQLTTLLDARPQGVLHEGEVGMAWRASDIYMHMARWMELNHGRVATYLAHGQIPELEADVDTLNERWVREDGAVSFREARRRAFFARDRFVAQLRGIEVARLTSRLLGMYEANAWGHYEEHLGYLGVSPGPEHA